MVSGAGAWPVTSLLTGPMCALPDCSPRWRAFARLAYTCSQKSTPCPVPEIIHRRGQCLRRQCSSARIGSAGAGVPCSSCDRGASYTSYHRGSTDMLSLPCEVQTDATRSQRRYEQLSRGQSSVKVELIGVSKNLGYSLENRPAIFKRVSGGFRDTPSAAQIGVYGLPYTMAS